MFYSNLQCSFPPGGSDECTQSWFHLDATVYGAVLQKLKSVLSPDEFGALCEKIKCESILDSLCVKPWNSEQLSSILDMLKYFVPTKARFNLDGKDKLNDFIEGSKDIQWLWSKSNPKAIKYFSECGEVFASVFQKLKIVLNQDQDDIVSICNELPPLDNESIVQLLSVKPYRANQIVSMWDLLKLNDNGKEQGNLLRGIVNWSGAGTAG